MKKLLLVMMVALSAVVLLGCDTTKNTAQGITADKIIIGNTAATEGAFAGVGVPFNLAMQVVFDEYNASNDGRDIEFIHYNDNFDGEQGLAHTKTLVEEDKVFALVGHFGTNTVNATMDYLLESGIPMVYGVTGVNSLYYNGSSGVGSNILSVQPIYRTEGRMLVARALHESLFGPNGDQKLGADSKILVLYSDDDAGQSIKVGIDEELAAQGVAANRVVKLPFAALNAAATVTTGLAQNPDVIILSSNQAPATAAATALREQNSTVPVITSYVNAATVFTPAQAKVDDVAQPLPYNVYANAWVDIVDVTAPAPTEAQVGGDGTLDGFALPLSYLPGFTAEYWEFVKLLNDSTRESGTTKAKSLWANPYAMAGYVAAKTFVALLERVEDFDTLTWESFIELAESAPIKLPLAGTVNWADGNRFGLDSLAFTKFVYSPQVTFAKVREVESISDVLKK
ncbi:ABC transporter substrate-binding protein [Acholeplasma granularum]|uniref:ABC transporter substrate-binding protein n=1 Tax=Acholeplasma granularum TaxID=264635 RepID=UPI00046EE9CE|nr:ABC transporter substrate-binding protein [Acholeplasma granularum]